MKTSYLLENRSRARLLFCFTVIAVLFAGCAPGPEPGTSDENRGIRSASVVPGILQPGALNAITDVPGVKVGHRTVIEGDCVRTGVTAILPHGGDLFHDRVPAAVHVGNGFGKLIGSTQVNELGELETPILLTNTLCVWKAADAMTGWMLARSGMEDVRSINPVVGETNDGYLLNDIRSRPIRAAHVIEALETASGGPVEEGSVGAGTGTIAFGWKGGIGTSSRVIPGSGWTVGVLVQSNFGGDLMIAGVPVGRLLGRNGIGEDAPDKEDAGSIMMIVATDAPLSHRNLDRIAKRAMMGIARTGSFAGNGSGDYVIAFSTASEVRRRPGEKMTVTEEVPNDLMSPLFQAVVEATEESVYNSLFAATSVSGCGYTVEALPRDEVAKLLEQHGMTKGNRLE
jgi:D-aminopeptidase